MMVQRGWEAGIYVHIPFCKSLCPYCDFYSKMAAGPEITAFIDALKTEAALRDATSFQEFRYDSIYFGGGTPSLLESGLIEEFLHHLNSHYLISDDTEITLEGNPESVSLNKAHGYRGAGINRISLGVQSFNDKHLLQLGRTHDSGKAIESCENLRLAGLENISLDLIFGLPGQTADDWDADLEKAINLSPEHISVYNLIIEPGTEFGRQYAAGRLVLPPDEEQKLMYDQAVATLQDAGYHRYEVSNFARPGRQCRHNLKYWNRIPHLGLGPSAVSFDGKTRVKNAADLDDYMKSASNRRCPPQEKEQIGKARALEETIMLGLRMAEGLSFSRLVEQFGYDLCAERQDVIKTMADNNLIEISDDRIRLTPQALFLTDEITLRLI